MSTVEEIEKQQLYPHLEKIIAEEETPSAPDSEEEKEEGGTKNAEEKRELTKPYLQMWK